MVLLPTPDKISQNTVNPVDKRLESLLAQPGKFSNNITDIQNTLANTQPSHDITNFADQFNQSTSKALKNKYGYDRLALQAEVDLTNKLISDYQNNTIDQNWHDGGWKEDQLTNNMVEQSQMYIAETRSSWDKKIDNVNKILDHIDEHYTNTQALTNLKQAIDEKSQSNYLQKKLTSNTELAKKFSDIQQRIQERITSIQHTQQTKQEYDKAKEVVKNSISYIQNTLDNVETITAQDLAHLYTQMRDASQEQNINEVLTKTPGLASQYQKTQEHLYDAISTKNLEAEKQEQRDYQTGVFLQSKIRKANKLLKSNNLDVLVQTAHEFKQTKDKKSTYFDQENDITNSYTAVHEQINRRVQQLKAEKVVADQKELYQQKHSKQVQPNTWLNTVRNKVGNYFSKSKNTESITQSIEAHNQAVASGKDLVAKQYNSQKYTELDPIIGTNNITRRFIPKTSYGL